MSEVKIAPIPDLGQRTDEITIYAGPCSVESAEQFDEVAECIADLGLTWIRGGAFKPRTNPHSFQGLGEEALKIMKSAGDRYNLKTLTEVMDSAHCQLVADYVDGLQVGALDSGRGVGIAVRVQGVDGPRRKRNVDEQVACL